MIPKSHTKNYFVSYDLNGSVPTHALVDKVMAQLSVEYGRVLETVWYVRSNLSLEALYANFNGVLTSNDRVLVIEANDAWMRNLLVPVPAVQKAWALAA